MDLLRRGIYVLLFAFSAIEAPSPQRHVYNATSWSIIYELFMKGRRRTTCLVVSYSLKACGSQARVSLYQVLL